MPRPAATVVPLREAPGGPEILMVRRSRGASFMADAFVFPGGRVEERDGVGEPAFRRAAVRELLEEAAIAIAEEALVPLAHWVTPSLEPKRYDTRFYLTEVDLAEVARHDEVETVEHLWSTARALLERQSRGELKLPPPTLRTLEELCPHASVRACFEFARKRPIVPIMPKITERDGQVVIVLPWDPDYSALPGEGTAIAADHPLAVGASRLVLAEGRWWKAP
jgi:8-oxo-dGTP pyrophosphatase MutT (NUDIX family)